MKPNTKRAMGGSKRQAGIGPRDERGKEAEYQRTAQHPPSGGEIGKPIQYEPPRRSEEPFDTSESLPIGERYYHASEDEESSERGDEPETSRL